MYRCDECGKSTEKRQKMLRRVVFRSVRHKEGTQGTEIEREIKLCPNCRDKQPKSN